MKVKGWAKTFYANRNEKSMGVAMLMSDKRDFKVKIVIKRQRSS